MRAFIKTSKFETFYDKEFFLVKWSDESQVKLLIEDPDFIVSGENLTELKIDEVVRLLKENMDVILGKTSVENG